MLCEAKAMNSSTGPLVGERKRSSPKANLYFFSLVIAFLLCLRGADAQNLHPGRGAMSAQDMVKMAARKPPVLLARRFLQQPPHRRNWNVIGPRMKSQHLAISIFKNKQIRMARLQKRFRSIFDRKPVVGRHQRLENRLIRDQSRALLGLRTSRRLDLSGCGRFSAQRRNQILANMLAHSRLDKHQHRSRQKKHDRDHRYQKLGPKMLERPFRHATASLRRSRRIGQTLWSRRGEVKPNRNLAQFRPGGTPGLSRYLEKLLYRPFENATASGLELVDQRSHYGD